MGTTGGFKLTVVSGKGAGQVLEVAGQHLTPIKIGRHNPDPARDLEVLGRPASPERDLLVNADTQISRLHAKIVAGPDGYLLTDCGSVNRTRLNGRPLTSGEAVPLRQRDELQLGPDTRIRFELRPEEPRTEIPPPPRRQPLRPERSRESSGANPLSSLASERPAAPPLPPERQEEDAAGSTPPVGPASERPAAPPPQEGWGKFTVYKTLSEGSGVRVNLAIDGDRNERVALKRFSRAALSGKARSTLLASAQRARSWHHANIAEVLDHGEQGEFVFVVSRWIEGKSLYDLQRAHAKEVDIPLALHLTREICAALRHAQGVERGFVWRNLNPRNVVVDQEGRAVVVNFGLPSTPALIEGRDPIDSQEARYLSPEQRNGRDTDPRSDIYSAGVILYELLGQKPVDAKKRLNDAVNLREDIPWDVADVANKAVTYQQERRFLHAADMEEALAAVLQKVYPHYGSEPAAWIAKYLAEPSAA
jgi:pSer/pThr/pTyr-binding forkhead associated (FHA) protein